MTKFLGAVVESVPPFLQARTWFVALFLALAAPGFSLGLLAQAKSQTPAKSSTEPESVASGDTLSGVWNAIRGSYDVASFSKGDPPMTLWGEEQFKAAKPSQGPRGVSLKETTDKVYKCQPPGMPYIYLQLFPMQIIRTPKEVIEFFELRSHRASYLHRWAQAPG